jgi:hypothetical protein
LFASNGADIAAHARTPATSKEPNSVNNLLLTNTPPRESRDLELGPYQNRYGLATSPDSKPADLGGFSALSNPHESREAWPALEEGVAALTEAGYGPGALGGVKDEDPVDPESAY